MPTREKMRAKLLRTYGIDETQDDEIGGDAGIADDFLDEAVKDMNSHLYEFNKRWQTLDLAAGTNNYELTDETAETEPTDGSNIIPYRESYAYLVDSAGGRLPMTYLPWVKFAERLGNIFYSNTGTPELYSFRNIDFDGKVYVWPTPSNTTYDMVLEFYKRIPLYSETTAEGTTPSIPEDVETALFYNAAKRLAIHLYGPSHDDVAAFHELEQDALTRLKAVDKRHPDQQQRFVVSDFRNRNRVAGRRSLYIKV
jgi:hypothetical protein